MSSNPNDNRTPLERLMRLGWDALDAARRAEPMTLDKMAQNARDALETARKGIMDETALKSFTFQAPLDNATAASVELELSVGETAIAATATADSHLLIDADLRYLGALAFGVSGDTQRQVFLRQATPITVGWVNPIHWATRPRWDVALAPGIPLDLRVRGGVGDVDLNLTRLSLASLRVEGNIGPVNVTLPTRGDAFPVTLTSGAGPIAVNVPKGANAMVSLRGALGSFTVNIAPGAEVLVQRAGGVGQAELVPGFDRVEAAVPGLPTTARWATPGYDTAARRVLVSVSEATVGNIGVRVMREE